MLKRFISLLLVLLLCCSLAACAIGELMEGPEQGNGLEIVTKEKDPTPSTVPPADSEKQTDAGSETEPAGSEAVVSAPDETEPEEQLLDEDGWYNSKEEVALYIHQYGKLPGNYITKKEAEALGWPGGSLEPYAPGKSIGGTYFGNYEGLLPTAKGRKYTECDIDTAGKSSRGAKRIVFSNDGLIYYTGDHYESFELLYGEP